MTDLTVLSLGDRIELARLHLKFTRIVLGQLETALDKDGGTAHAAGMGRTKQLAAQVELSLEETLAVSGRERVAMLDAALSKRDPDDGEPK